MRHLFAIALLAAAACAPTATSTASGGAGNGPARILTSGSGVDFVLDESAPLKPHAVPAAPHLVFAALPEVYRVLGVPPGTSDPAGRVFGNQRFTARRELGGQPLSRYLACGHTATGAPIADSYRVQLSLLTTVQPGQGGGSLVQTQVGASAQSVEGSSSNRVQCATTGALELRIARMLGARH